MAQERYRKKSPNLESYRHGSKRKAEREREREREREAKPPNLLIVALSRLALFAWPLCLHFRSYTHTPSVHAMNKENTKPADKQKR